MNFHHYQISRIRELFYHLRKNIFVECKENIFFYFLIICLCVIDVGPEKKTAVLFLLMFQSFNIFSFVLLFVLVAVVRFSRQTTNSIFHTFS